METVKIKRIVLEEMMLSIVLDLIDDEDIKTFNEIYTVYKSGINIFKVIGILIVCALPMAIYFLISSTNLAVIFIFKVSLPFFVTLFLLYGPGLYLMISLGLCNMKFFLIGAEEETEKLV